MRGLILFFYTGGLLDWSALPGMWETFHTWVNTGTAEKSGHEKDWDYWLTLLGRYEWPAGLGLFGSVWLLFPRTPRAARYLAIYGIGALIGYSIVPYKTPWCIISLIWPFYFVFGLGTVRLAQWIDGWTIGVAAGVLCLGSFGLTWKLNFRDYTDDSEPYVYVQTFTDVNELLEPLHTLARRDPLNYQLRGHISLPEQYPFSWLLADFPRIDYPSAEELPEPLDADFLLIDNEHVDLVEPKLRQEYYKMPVRIRGNSDNAATLYLCCQTFAGVVPSNYPIFLPGTTTQALAAMNFVAAILYAVSTSSLVALALAFFRGGLSPSSGAALPALGRGRIARRFADVCGRAAITRSRAAHPASRNGWPLSPLCSCRCASSCGWCSSTAIKSKCSRPTTSAIFLCT